MSKSARNVNGSGSSDATTLIGSNAPSAHPAPLPREPSSSSAPRTDSQPSKQTSQSTQTPQTTQTSQTSAASSAAPSPLPSREPSPTRPLARTNTSRASSANAGNRSRKNSQPEISPSRPSRSNLPAQPPPPRTLFATTTPTLLPATTTDASTKTPVPQKSPTTDHPRDTPRWPVSPRLRSPPPVLNRPSLGVPRKGDPEPPLISVQRSSPSPQPSAQDTASDPDVDDVHLLPGTRTPARGTGGSTSTLETVQEVSPLASPGQELNKALEKLEDSVTSETSSQLDTLEISASKTLKARPHLPANESGSESGSISADRRSGAASAPPLLTTRQSSASAKPTGGAKGKVGEGSLQSMIVETETVTSIPQVALAPATGPQGSNGSLRTKPSSETIRPKKEKKKSARKTTTVTSGTASSKADIFEAKVASAVEEANSSDSEETFVYDSNPPDGGDRPRRFHSRTPSATSMASQVDRNGMRSIHSVMEGAGPSVATKKNMKFVSNAFSSNGGNNDSIVGGDEDGKGTGRSVASGRGTARHHHHVARWGRNGSSNGHHTSVFEDDFPFPGAARNTRHTGKDSRHSSGPPSPRGAHHNGRDGTNGKRSLGYDLDDTTTGADDERTPLIPAGATRSTRSGRTRRPYMTVRSLEQQRYRETPSFLNRFASCLVLTVMLLLVISGAIGFMFATSQPLTDIQLVAMKNVLASEQELMLDITVKAHNPNVVVVVVDSADIEVFAKSPHAGTDSEWWRQPKDSGAFASRRTQHPDGAYAEDDSPEDPPRDDTAPNMRLGSIYTFDSPLSFEGSFFHQGISSSTGEVRLRRPGNGTDHGSERWERILDDEFDLILKGVLKYSLPLSQRIRTAPISGRTTVKPNSANDPTLRPNGTDASIS